MSDEIQRILGRIESNISGIQRDINDIKDSHKEQQKSIQSLKTFKAQSMIVFTGAFIGIGAVIKAIWDVVKHKVGI